MRRQLIVEVDCGEKTCRPCMIRDTRQIGVQRHAPFCVAFRKRLSREKETHGDGLRLTIRCRACIEAERKATMERG